MAVKRVQQQQKTLAVHYMPGKYPHVPQELEYLCQELTQFRVDPMNPRINDAAAVELAELIRVAGFRDPIEVDSDGVARAGNTRLKAAKILGMTHAPVIRHRFTSSAAATAYTIANNKAQERSQWDDEVLGQLLGSEEIQQVGATGFSEQEVRGVLMLPDLDKVEKVNAKNTGLKDKIIVLVMDAAKKAEVKTMLETWITASGLTGIEVK